MLETATTSELHCYYRNAHENRAAAFAALGRAVMALFHAKRPRLAARPFAPAPFGAPA